MKKRNKTHTIDRQKLLRKLEAVSAGLALKRDTVQQGKCFAFVSKRIWAYNGEVACCAPSGLPEEVEGAVHAPTLMSALREMVDDAVELSFNGSILLVSGKGREFEVTAEAEISMPVENVERPGKGDWLPLPEDFGAAVGVVQNCAVKEGPEVKEAFTFIHVHPRWVEACDNQQLTRFRIKTGIGQPTCLKRDAIKSVTSLDMTEFAETDGWLHFRNPAKVQLSCLRHVEEFPDLTEFLKVSGEPITLPKGISKDAKFAEIFSKEVEDRNLVVVTIKPGRIIVKGIGVTGRGKAERSIKYRGKSMAFGIAPKLLQEITKKHVEAQVSKDHLRVDGDGWSFVTCLESPDAANTKADKAAEVAALETETPDDESED